MRAALVAAALFAGTSAGAETVEQGRALYAAHCATCHGLFGAGDGPMAGVMAIEVANLRRLSAEAGGRFPLRRAIATIDGRTELRGHGGPMPVYGLSLGGEPVAVVAEDGEELTTGADFLALARYLETLQE
jgi:mono/diheme cytochrome c family protein